MTSRRRSWRVVGVALAAASALLLGACAGGGGSSSGERTYVEAIAQDPNGFNPNLQGGPIPLRFGFMILGTIVQLTDQYEVEPALAETWDLSEDGTHLTLNLREGVTWHDGEPFTADDVVFNFTEIFPMQAQYGKPIADNITSIEATDETTVDIDFSAPYAPMLESISQLTVVPKHLYEGTDYLNNPANMAPIGTGPMKFESYESGAQVVLVKNEDWWGGETEVDRAVFPVMSDPAARALALQNGEIDSALVDMSAQEQFASNDKIGLMDGGYFPQNVTLTFNSRLDQLGTEELRALVFSAIDREAIVERGLNGFGSVADQFFPEEMGWVQDPNVSFDKSFPRDVDAIGAAFDAAGFPVGSDGYRFTLDVRYISSLSDVAATAEVIKSSLDEVGINVNLVGSADAVYQDEVYVNHDFGIALLRSTVSSDPNVGVTRWLTTNPDDITKLRNASGISDSVIDEAAATALVTMDREARAAQFSILQERAAELIYFAPLVWTPSGFNTVNESRWSGLAAGEGQTNSVPWGTMTWVGA